jgi:hypothetical protein
LNGEITYIEGGTQYRKSKPRLIDDIIAIVESKGNRIFPDWMTRAEQRRTVWKKVVFNPARHYTKEELQGIARKLGIKNISHDSIGELTRKILNETHEEKEEKEHKAELFEPEIEQDDRFHKTTVIFRELPVYPSLISTLINRGSRTNIHIPNGSSSHMFVRARARTISSRKDTGMPEEVWDNYIVCDMKVFNSLSGKVTKKQVAEWIKENEKILQHRCERSDEYIEINRIEELPLRYSKYQEQDT